jgi:endonuclease III
MPRSEKPKPVRGLQTPVPDANRVLAIQSLLAQLYPETTTALQFETPFQLAIATILSAQCTDKRVNLVTPALFARFPDAAALAHADMEEIQKLIQSTGFFRAKARNIQACAQKILDQHAGKLPETLEELIALPGIGRKTANVVLGDAFGVPGITVDTHVGSTVPATRPERAYRPRQGRKGSHALDSAGRMDAVQPSTHLSWSAGVPRTQTAMFRMPAHRPLPENRCRTIKGSHSPIETRSGNFRSAKTGSPGETPTP